MPRSWAAAQSSNAVALAPRGSETGRCLSVADYVRGRRPPGRRIMLMLPTLCSYAPCLRMGGYVAATGTRCGHPPLEGASVGYPPRAGSRTLRHLFSPTRLHEDPQKILLCRPASSNPHLGHGSQRLLRGLRPGMSQRQLSIGYLCGSRRALCKAPSDRPSLWRARPHTVHAFR